MVKYNVSKPAPKVGRAPGGGRPPAFKEPEGPPPDQAVFVEGRARVNGDDAEAFELVGRLRAAAEPLGLHVHSVNVYSDDLNAVRREFGTHRVDMEFAFAWIKDYPEITYLKWVEEVFLAGEPLNEITFAAAKAKAKVMLHRLHKAGRVKKGKNAYGQMTLRVDGAKALRPDEMPGDLLVDVNKAVDAVVSEAQAAGKTPSAKAAAAAAAAIVWKARLFYES